MTIKAYPLLEQDEAGEWYCIMTVTCLVIGEMNDGRKVWYSESRDEEYVLGKVDGKYYFYKG